MNKIFQTLVTSLNDDGTYSNNIIEKSVDDLPDGEILIKVEYSSLNYKDALSATGKKGVTRLYPHTPGIDAAGIVEESSSRFFPIGTPVIVTGHDLGMNTSGGFGNYIRVPSKWVAKCPSSLSTKEAMMIGTAGLTAGLSIEVINEKFSMPDLEIVVTGATGGVGSVAVKILSSLGAHVTAITGKVDAFNYLKDLGASEIILRDDFLNSTQLPLNKGLYTAAIDVVGGKILSALLASMKYRGIITACGNVGGPNFETTVFPFILRNNSLIGIDSAETTVSQKEIIWNKFANGWKIPDLESFCKTVTLNDLIPEINKIIKGNLTGRVVVQF